MTIRILLVDDHELVRSGFRRLLDGRADIEVVGEAENGRRALEMVEELRPDIVVMDVAMPGLNGTDATRKIVKAYFDTKILALSMHSSHRVISEMFQAGASGYLLKSSALEELLNAVLTVNKGKTYLAPDVAGTIVDDYLRKRRKLSNLDQAESTVLSSREREILQLVAEGLTNREIAISLGISVKTVEVHRFSIMQKLNIRSVAELTKYAIREGLTALDN